MKKIRETELRYREGSSDKVYIANIHQREGGGYSVICYYGRRGSTLKETNKGTFYDILLAEHEFNNVVDSKKAKGYTVYSDVSPVEKEVPAENLVKFSESVKEPIEETVLVCEEGAREKALARLKAASVW